MQSNIDFQQLAVSGVQKLHPYQPGKPIEELERELGITNILKLASNENPLGASPKAQVALANPLKTLELYPDGSGYQLKAAIAQKLGLQSAQITLGNGSNDVLDMIARVYLDNSRAAVFSEYAFAVYPIVTLAVGAELRIAKANPPDHHTMPYGHNLPNLAAKIDDKTRLVFIANPNNPTGTWLGKDDLHRFLQRVPEDVIVVIDEAYTEYVQDAAFPNALAWLEEFPNLIVTRTFSKIYGLAGLRVGYAISNPAVADMLNRVRQPFNVNSLALAAAEAALDDDEFLKHSVMTNTAGLQQWFDACAEQGWEYIPTVGNFITLDCKRPAAPLYDALLREGVIVRPIGAYGLPHHLRITIGSESQNTRCINALKKVLAA
ncbi:MAG TPA: histidinol-phosphate transaminase [Candidatus Thiothrix moscowensis]|uniref:histidinol-phosphate transaminase n=1 Tax=unclassified Thiothrix TaxID=2636184 RepID=UPI0025D46A89|nr:MULTISPECIES: histidinol-phosphate transaminase [unclassified Thiothrix]HRJ53551.1 histidinol-phosphate transaminase [Candidatus Thiothrix moscowensis]HRJ93641.1 histidinol-phosphate transaminase [Candidatus Thiothrix moscowensis]